MSVSSYQRPWYDTVLSAVPKPCDPPPPSQLWWSKAPSVPQADGHLGPCQSLVFTFYFVNYVSDSQRAPKLREIVSATSLPPTDSEMEITFHNLWLPPASPGNT